MTPDELKAEIFQLVVENSKLREGLFEINEWGDFAARKRVKQALQLPPTHGLGAAMLRVVEAAVALKEWQIKSSVGTEWLMLAGRVGHEFASAVDDIKALNEMESK